MAPKVPFAAAAIISQLVFLVLFAIFADYDVTADGSNPINSNRINGSNPADNPVNHYYPMFQDVHVMIFVGFGFLMTFMKRYGFSAIGLNLMISAFAIQWSILVAGFLSFIHHPASRFTISIESLINGDFAAAAVLITFGALLGKVSPVQLLMIALIEVAVFRVNEYIGLEILRAADTGGSMYVHAFGAYFGLSVARVMYRDDVHNNKNEGSNYHSDLFSMIGSLFLWMYWPSFNGALVTGDRQHRAVINTYLALVSCVMATFTAQNIICKNKKFDMVHVQNATLAGGVAIGTCADMMIHPAGAISVGIAAGILSSVGFEYLTPALSNKRLHDTCGVNNLHGMPGLMAGVIGIIMAGVSSESLYNYSLYEIYPERAPVSGSADLAQIQTYIPDVSPGTGRSSGIQAGYQAAALVVTVAMACVSGAITGLIVHWACWHPPMEVFDDEEWWSTPDDFLPSSNHKTNTTNGVVAFRPNSVDSNNRATQGTMNPAFELTSHRR